MNSAPRKPVVRLIASQANWIEGEAVRQLEKTAELPGMRAAIGMPDLHPGRGNPIGAAFAAEGHLYPFLVGNDVGCGMGLWRTGLERRKVKLDRWTDRLSGLEAPWEGDTTGWLARDNLAPTPYDSALGTIGGGNHFAELQEIDEIHDEAAVAPLELDVRRLVLLVHSGSRGLGESILRDHTDRHGAAGLNEEGEEAGRYLERHDHAVAWARANRALIAQRFLDRLNGEGERVLDVCHNNVTRAEVAGCTCWLHRKGAAPADEGPVVIPGSRGALSYLVQPTGDLEQAGWSLAHGAGRRWTRSDAKSRMKARFTADALTRTELGSRVICEDKDLLYEEAPQAYKNIDVVVKDLVDAGFCRILATFRPLITYKVRAER